MGACESSISLHPQRHAGCRPTGGDRASTAIGRGTGSHRIRVSSTQVYPVGDRGFLIEVQDNSLVHALARTLTESFAESIDDVVTGHVTVLVTWRREPISRQRLEEVIGTALAIPPPVLGSTEVEIPVHYDGEDIAAVAARTDLQPAEVVSRHTRCVYRVAFTGFAPGLAYLIGGDERLFLPRRAEPRERVPEGSVAIAGPYTTIYPRVSPGGWHLLGTTDESLFDLNREQPSLLRPGMTVRFVDTGER